jgi:hypothetical protein
MKIVVDTWIIKTAGKPSLEENCLLFAIHSKGCILVMDTDGEIMKEYRRNFVELTRKWYQDIENQGRIHYISKKLSSEIRNHLQDIFDFSDIKFVEVAYHTSEKIIFSGDSDYFNEPAASYIKDSLGISALKTNDALDYVGEVTPINLI